MVFVTVGGLGVGRDTIVYSEPDFGIDPVIIKRIFKNNE